MGNKLITRIRKSIDHNADGNEKNRVKLPLSQCESGNENVDKNYSSINHDVNGPNQKPPTTLNNLGNFVKTNINCDNQDTNKV